MYSHFRNLNVHNAKDDNKSEKSLINATLQSVASGSSQDEDSRALISSQEYVLQPFSDRSEPCLIGRRSLACETTDCFTDAKFRFGAHETGRFRYGDLHENGHHLFCGRPSSACGRDPRKSLSMSDLRDACSSCSSELALDSDHAHVENPEERAKMRLVNPINRGNGSLDIESDAGDIDSILSNSLLSNSLLSNVSNTDQGASSEIMGEMESPLTDLEVCGILSNLENKLTCNRSYHKKLSEPSFQLIVDEGTDKDDSLSTEQSSSSQAPGKNRSLRIHISPTLSTSTDRPHSPSQFNNESSNEFESETGIPNSPTLYISGVSICRSPEPRSPKSPRSSVWLPHSPMSPHRPHTPVGGCSKERSSSLMLPANTLQCNVSGSTEPVRINRSGSYTCSFPAPMRLLASPQPDHSRTRSSSLIVPGTVSPSIARMKRPLSGNNIQTADGGVNFVNFSFGGTSSSNKLAVSHQFMRKTSLGAEIGTSSRMGLHNHRFRNSIAESHIGNPGLSLGMDHLTVSQYSGSSISLQPTRASSPLQAELRLSKSASEYEKSRLVFQFPNSPVDGSLSSVLHVEESNLSSDDFHEALFLTKSPRSSKRKKSKKDRNKEAHIKAREMWKSKMKEFSREKDCDSIEILPESVR